jgi:crotonobetainyl-CoA:carnitine CoA-transferase CaiB-like acyl-CoA transferase
MSQPLEGIRVIDFGRFIAAPYCGMLLADMGADVIRVERREGGEDRGLGPVTEAGEGGMYLNLNRNKRGITLELGTPQGEEIVRRLIASADVAIVNLPIVTMKKVKLDYDSLREIKPDVILVMASAFGPDGPYAERVGFDGVAQAMSGAMSLTGFPDNPVRSIVPWVDYGTALHGAFGAATALYHRERTGEGQVIDISLLATSVTFMQPMLAERANTDVVRTQWGNTGFYSAPNDVYKTRDGWITVACVGDWMFRRWCNAVGRPDMIEDPRMQTDISRADHHDVISEVMSKWCADRTNDEVIAEMEKNRIACGKNYLLDQTLADPQVKARGLLQEVPSPIDGQPVPLAPAPARLSRNEKKPLRPAPRLGQHTDEVLGELGFSKHEIAAFREAGTI